MKERFEGESGLPRLVEALTQQKIVSGHAELAKAIARMGELREIPKGVALINQGSSDDSVFLIISGLFDIVVNGRLIANRRPGDHVGEMAATEPTQPRSAAVIAAEPSIVVAFTRDQFWELGDRFTPIWRNVAKELSRRLMQRNNLIGQAREKLRVFVLSSVEALPIARALQNAFEFDPFTVIVWTDGVFKVSSYPLDSLEEQLDESDFAIAVAAADDVTISRNTAWPAPRDNVTFELGFFMGRLGRERTFLLEPRGEEIKLPSDLAGLTTLSYVREAGQDAAARLAPVANRLREIILDRGPRL